MITPTHFKTKIGICEVCSVESEQKLTLRVNANGRTIWFCVSCWNLEQETVQNTNSVIAESKSIDAKVQIRTDLFNAATMAIVELKESIDKDDNITNKPYELAKILKDRFDHLKSVVFELNKQLVDAGNNQKAIQVYMNNLANSLRAEERDRLRIADINYRPQTAKVPTVKKIGPAKKKFDKVELRNAVMAFNKEIGKDSKTGVTEFLVQGMVVSGNCSISEAIDKIRTMMAQANSTNS